MTRCLNFQPSFHYRQTANCSFERNLSRMWFEPPWCALCRSTWTWNQSKI